MKDNYGKEIKYNINNWIGEDSAANNNLSENIVSNNSIKTNSLSGNINISLSHEFDLNENATILISLISDKFETQDLYLYGKNEFKNNFTLPVGKYDISLIMDMSTNTILYTNIKSFTIKNSETMNLLIDKKEVIKTEYYETSETIKYDTEKKINNSSFFSFIIIIIAFLIIGLIVYKIIKKRVEE